MLIFKDCWLGKELNVKNYHYIEQVTAVRNLKTYALKKLFQNYYLLAECSRLRPVVFFKYPKKLHCIITFKYLRFRLYYDIVKNNWYDI